MMGLLKRIHWGLFKPFLGWLPFLIIARLILVWFTDHTIFGDNWLTELGTGAALMVSAKIISRTLYNHHQTRKVLDPVNADDDSLPVMATAILCKSVAYINEFIGMTWIVWDGNASIAETSSKATAELFWIAISVTVTIAIFGAFEVETLRIVCYGRRLLGPGAKFRTWPWLAAKPKAFTKKIILRSIEIPLHGSQPNRWQASLLIHTLALEIDFGCMCGPGKKKVDLSVGSFNRQVKKWLRHELQADAKSYISIWHLEQHDWSQKEYHGCVGGLCFTWRPGPNELHLFRCCI